MATRRTKATFILAAFLLLAAWLGTYAWDATGRRWSLPFALDADPVLATPIDGMAWNATDPQIRGWMKGGQPVTVPADIASDLRKVLADSSTYKLVDTQCFVPHIAFSFGQGPGRVDVVVCLFCDRVYFYRGDQSVGHSLTHEGHNRLMAIYRRIFHADPEMPSP